MRGLGYRLTDALVIAACSLAFIAVISPGRYEPKNPPIAPDLGTTPEHFRQVPEKIAPRHLSGPPPTDAEEELAAALYVSVEQLDTVMEKYRPLRLKPR